MFFIFKEREKGTMVRQTGGEFTEEYYEYAQLNNVEKDAWNDILRFVFIDEGLWAIVNLEDDESERQKEFIKSLIEFNEEDFEL